MNMGWPKKNEQMRIYKDKGNNGYLFVFTGEWQRYSLFEAIVNVYSGPSPSLCGINKGTTDIMNAQRLKAANYALIIHEFEADESVEQDGRWEEDGLDGMVCRVWLNDGNESYIRAFIVRFEPGTARVIDAHHGDRQRGVT
jgi:hypothetical protein